VTHHRARTGVAWQCLRRHIPLRRLQVAM